MKVFTVNTPEVEVKYVYLQNVSQYGKYEATAIFDRRIKEHEEFLQMLKSEVRSIGGNYLPAERSKQDPYKIELKLSQHATVNKNGNVYNFKPVIYDSNAVERDDLPKIGQGSICRFNVEAREYNMGGKKGFRLNPVAVQVIHLEEFKSKQKTNPFSSINNQQNQQKNNPFAYW